MTGPSDRPPLHSLRDDLAALRIDRSAGGRRRLSPAALLRRIAAVLLVLAGAGFAAYRATLGRAPQVRVAYATRTVDARPGAFVRESLTGSGYVITQSHYISLGVRVAGRIEAYLVEEGEHVAKGQPLVRLDARPFEADQQRLQAERAVAVANVDLQRKDLQRILRLHANDVSSEAQVDLKENQLRVAQAELARSDAELTRIHLDLEDTVLRSPVSGLVLEKLKEAGEMATPGGFAGSGELIRLANLEELRAEVDVNESDLSKVAFGQDAEVHPDADPSRRYAARVVKLAPQVNRQKGTLRIEVRILEPDAWLKPDMSVRIRFLEAAKGEVSAGGAGGVVAPAGAVRRDDRGVYAWVVSKGEVRRQILEVGATSADEVPVLSGLLGGEALVVGAAGDWLDGQRVTVEP